MSHPCSGGAPSAADAFSMADVTDGQAFHARNRAAALLGIEVVDLAPGRATLSMVLRADMTNPHGIGHGGIVFTLADTAFGYAANAGQPPALALTAEITFVAPCRPGDVLQACATRQSQGGRTAVYDVRVTDRAGTLIALFRGIAYRTGPGTAPR